MTQHVAHRASDEIAQLNAEIDRLRAQIEGDSSIATLFQSKQADEIDRLRAVLKDRAVLLENAYAQRDRLRAENARMRDMLIAQDTLIASADLIEAKARAIAKTAKEEQ